VTLRGSACKRCYRRLQLDRLKRARGALLLGRRNPTVRSSLPFALGDDDVPVGGGDASFTDALAAADESQR
jgi:hypothetical protein